MNITTMILIAIMVIAMISIIALFRDTMILKAKNKQLAIGLSNAKPIFYDYFKFREIYGRKLTPQLGTLLVLPNDFPPKSIVHDDEWAEVAKEVWKYIGPCPSGFCGGESGDISWNAYNTYNPYEGENPDTDF